MVRAPPRLAWSLPSSLVSTACSFLGRRLMRPSSTMASSSSMRWMRERMVTKLVSMPPSQRWLM